MDPRRATRDDAAGVARMLHDFNTEFDTPSPGPAWLETRLQDLLASDSTIAVVTGSLGLALVTLRPNVWYQGPVALLDELYVVPSRRGEGIGTDLLRFTITLVTQAGAELMEINVDEGDTDARRFYERHGFSATEPTTGEGALYYWRELA